MANVERILIVGGGIAGLSAAIALHRKGWTPELVERSAAWPTVGAGINLPANGVRVLREFGPGDALDRVGAVIRQWAFLDQHGNLLCATDLEDLWRDVGPCLGVTRIRLHETLLSGVADTVRCRLGVSLAALSQDSDFVCVNFSDGTSGEYDLVVGADGIYSTVRQSVIEPSPPTYAGQMVWRSVIPTRPPGIIEMMVLMGDRRIRGAWSWLGMPRKPDYHTWARVAVWRWRMRSYWQTFSPQPIPSMPLSNCMSDGDGPERIGYKARAVPPHKDGSYR